MRKLCLLLIAVIGLPAFAAGQSVVEEIIARVNDQIITRSEFTRSKDQLRDDVKQQDPTDPDKVYAQREKDVLRDLIDQELLLEKGKDLGITGDTDLIKRLDEMRKEMKLDTMEDLEKAAAAQGISYEDFKQNLRNQIITQKVIGEEVGSHLSISKEEEQKFYDEHKSELEQPEEVRLSEILIAPKPAADKPAAGTAEAPNTATPQPSDPVEKQAADAAALGAAEAKANDLMKQIRGGAAFDELAKKYSDGPTAAQGGDLGTFKRGDMVGPFEQAAFTLKIGELSEPVKSQYGYHLIKVESRESRTFAEVKPELEKRVGPEMTQKAVQDLEKQAGVTLDSDFFGAPAK